MRPRPAGLCASRKPAEPRGETRPKPRPPRGTATHLKPIAICHRSALLDRATVDNCFAVGAAVDSCLAIGVAVDSCFAVGAAVDNRAALSEQGRIEPMSQGMIEQ